MNNENTKKLFERFPFFHPERPITESLMAFGFECGDGWFDIIWNLCEGLEKIVDKDFRVEQVKEKFGGLRFYTNYETDEISNLITHAEAEASNTCEVCGKPGKLRGKGWVKTLCKECDNG